MTLKPCPFAHDDDDLEVTNSGTPHVYCLVCRAAGPWVDVDDFESQEAAEAKAVDMWNARAGEPAPTTKGN